MRLDLTQPCLPALSQPSLKISILVSDLSKSGAGRWGGAVRPFLLAQALRQAGYTTELIGFTEGEAAVVSTPELPVKSVQGRLYPQFCGSAHKLLQQIEGDILYAYKPKPSSFGLALIHRLTTRKPLILDIDDWELSWHGGDDYRYQWGIKSSIRDFLMPAGALRQPDHPLYLQRMETLIRQADAVTVHNQFLAQRFGGAFVPNGKDVKLFDPQQYGSQALKQRYGLANYRTLMFPGAPRPYKGLEDVLAALDLLDQPDLRLVIVGGSPYDDYDQHLMQQWSHRIIQLPRQPADQMPEIVAAADVIVVPQRDTAATRAQFPLKLTDGMAMAKPVLASRVGDIPSILADTGYLVDPDAPDQLATAIQSIFADPAAAAHKGLSARARCVEHYSIEAMSKRLAGVISNLVDPSEKFTRRCSGASYS
ncbi:MAG: glycosyltransferase family 4 protein [Pegethrix bostrychoides GSE-TBD4-15B]|jgi:glycosyltransferase involved in cell wall biosynthesis|uniref:Glycosyltransferase family 4 protein n=1 Tax=Pegethrix bostrychoides GSE-TBD4-15B TaxID=2839662 RepID=A0A951PD91_9CYAN|nr:glycosyltransferase family 4 protein [Pegethrix bostrychoides GSE-TBD4-15B]